MNIGIVCYPTYGGSGVIATELGKALSTKGYNIHFISHSRPARLDHFSKNLHYHEVNLLDYPLFKYPPAEIAMATKIVNVAKFEKLDVIHVHYAIPHAYSAYMAKQILAAEGINLPFITTLHGTDITVLGRDASYEPAISFCINQSDKVTAVSEFLKNETFKYFKINRDINVIPNFVDFNRFRIQNNTGVRENFAENGEKILVHTSNFRKVKRVQDVIKVFERVREKMPAKLLFIGDGPERNNVEQACRETPYCKDVQFLGKIGAVEHVLSIGDLFVLPSGEESFGLAALESMACGMPVVSSNTGGIPEVNIHGYSGYVSNTGDTDDMAQNAVEILGDDKKYQQFRENAFNRAQNFDIKAILPQYEEVYAASLSKLS